MHDKNIVYFVFWLLYLNNSKYNAGSEMQNRNKGDDETN